MANAIGRDQGSRDAPHHAAYQAEPRGHIATRWTGAAARPGVFGGMVRRNYLLVVQRRLFMIMGIIILLSFIHGCAKVW